MADDLTAELDRIRELAAERDGLLSRMAAVPLGGNEWTEANDRYCDVQDQLAAWAPCLGAALGDVLRLTAPPAPLDVLYDRPLGYEVSKEVVREAITREMTAGQVRPHGLTRPL